MLELIGLSLIGLIALIIELFVPAGGLIGLVGIGSIITAVVRSFQTQGATTGAIFLIAVLVILPTLFVLWFRYFPKTFVGKKLILMDKQSTETGYTSHSDTSYSDLAGKDGISLTPLRPSGTVRIEGRRYSAVTDGEFMEENENITVKKIEGNRIEVRKGEKR